MRRRFSAALYMAFALAVLPAISSSCSVGGQLPAPHPNGSPLPSAEVDQPHLLAVGMRPQAVAEPQFKSTSVVSPRRVLADIPAPRLVNETNEFTVLQGSAFLGGYEQLVTPLGDLAEYSANWDPALDPAFSDLSYAVYEFVISDGFSGDPTCSLEWLEEHSPQRVEDVWIGLSDWSSDSWSWYEFPSDSTVTFASFEDHARAEDGRLLAIVVLIGQQTCRLDRISIGEPELRATGEEEGDIEAPPAYPPLYVPHGSSATLPATADLSDDCAEINDQGTWGSCTCFATGDGALNYELNRLYADLDWDLSDDFNKVSPKYLYVESGKLQGFPEGPAYGRWTGQVVEDLLDHGVATEDNAPYDLVYDDDWSSDALDDAEQLTIANWLPIPCNGSSGIRNVKAVLAYYEQPLIMRINLDYWFTYYKPDTVWSYIGPSYGGHAMLIVGYDDSKQAFLVRNSWSSDWGDGGFVWIGYSTFSNGWAYVRCWTLFCDYDSTTAQRFTGQQSSLPPPTDVTASDGTDDEQINVSWTKSSAATGYQVYRDSHDTLVAELGDVNSWSDESIHDSNSHMYWVTAVDSSSESVFGAPDLGYLAQPPEIHYIIPTSGREGRAAIFIAAVYGSLPMDFSWDFGDAASPGTSTDYVPHVTLGDIGDYTVTLEVDGPWGSDSLEIPFTVHPGNPPIADLEADDTSGRTPHTVNFDASGSYDPDGAIVKYEWDWEDDGTFDETTTSPQNDHTYTEIGGTCCVMRVTDDSGLTDTRGRSLDILSTDNILPTLWWMGDTLGPPPVIKTYNVGSAYDQDGEIVKYEFDLDGDGTYELSGMKTEVSRTYTEHDTLTVKCRVTDNEAGVTEQQAQLIIGNGGEQSGWQIHEIEDFNSNQDVVARAAVVAGKPVVLAREGENDTLFSYHSTVAQPDSADDWTKAMIEDSVFVNVSIALSEIGGAAVIAYKAGNGLTYARHNGSAWVKHIVTAADTGGHDIREINGVPCIAYQQGVSLKYARATAAIPTSDSDWQLMDVGTADNVGGSLSLGSLSNIPMIGFGQRGFTPQLAFARATKVDPVLSTDWTWHFVEEELDNTDSIAFGVINGLPALVYAETSGENSLIMARAGSATPGSSTDWTFYAIDNQTTIRDVRLRYLAGLPAIGYFGGAGWPKVSLAEAGTTDPDEAGDWTIERLADRSSFHDMIEVQNQPAMIYSDDDTFTLYYYYRVPE